MIPTARVWQCVAVYCSMLQCVAVCCSGVIPDDVGTRVEYSCDSSNCCNRLTSSSRTSYFDLCILQCVALCYSVMQCVAV